MSLILQELPEKITDSHEVSYDIKKLETAMLLLIDEHNRIQDYRSEQDLAIYIADISSFTATNIKIDDPERRMEVFGYFNKIQSGITAISVSHGCFYLLCLSICTLLL